MRRSTTALALVLAASASPASAAGWRMVTTDSEVREEVGRSAAAFVDYESLRRDGGRITFWMMVVTEVPARSGMDNARALIEADCPPGRYRYLERIFLSASEILGRNAASEEEQAVPGSTGEAVIAAACGGIPQGSAVVDDPYRFGREQLQMQRQRGGK